MEQLIFTGENGEKISLFVLESTRLAGIDYILAADTETGDGTCYILKDVSPSDTAEAVYEMVDDDNELDYLLSVFAELLEDVDLDF